MTKSMPKNFDFASAESRIYAWWEENGYFKPEVADAEAEAYVISMPPPNVTGILHIGHAIGHTIEDLLIRHARMQGKAALWVPGTDHAGIATQLQVEKKLRNEGTSREEIGYEAFVKETWDWTEEHGGGIYEQMRRLGASADWDRQRFTLDEGLSKAVVDVFVSLYEDDLIYRGPRLVNWSPGLKTAVSDLEVERGEEEGKLHYFRYPVEGDEFIPVATTRPETILGDTALAVHPEDTRYKHLVGRKAFVPMLNREIPVIADEYVDREFGTGALKITPAHDFNDYEIGQRHNLALVNVLNKDATINENGGMYAGLDRFECRERIWADMEAAGLTIKVETHLHTVPRSQRGGEIVEPMISTQWFVKIQPLADKALAAVKNGEITIVPDRFTKIYYHWLENIQDWCVSRQLWWGHRIPAWYRGDEIYVGHEAPEGEGWVPEEDVLDTWFSSGLWPFSTLGWPEETDDLARYYPTSLMETGHDILFFWVVRMIMFGIWFTDENPFHTVLLHGLIRDKYGRKISKTLGNTIDPIELADQYGTDPLRFTLATGGTPGNDVNLDPAKIEHSWKFANKIWQMTNFIHGNLPENFQIHDINTEALDLPSQWMLHKLNILIGNVDDLFALYQFGEAGNQILTYLWDEFAPWYIEISKHTLYGEDETAKDTTLQVLLKIMDICLRLLHPYMPFITEEIWQFLPHPGEDALIIARWPKPKSEWNNPQAEQDMTLFMDLVRGIRNTRKEYNVAPSHKIHALIYAEGNRALIEQYPHIFARLCNVHQFELLETNQAPENAASIVVNDVSIYLPLEGMMDIEAECKRLKQEREKVEKAIQRAEGMLNNPGFVNNAPEDVVQAERDNLAELLTKRDSVDERLTQLC